MAHMVEVKQIRDRTDGAFLNVLCELGSVGVQAHIYKNPTYIIISESGQFVDFVQYVDEGWADEGLEGYAKRDGNWRVIPVSELIDDAALANAAASEVDAAQRAQECERELREAREWNDTLEAALQSIADVAERDMNEGRQGWGTQEIVEIARGVLEGF